jgi:hypothetical protein
MVTPLLEQIGALAVWSAAARTLRSNQPTYIGLGLLAALLVFVLIRAYRVWEEIHDVEEPDSPDDLLASFERAHVAGELDDDELARVRARLGRSSTFAGPSAPHPLPSGVSAPAMPAPPVEPPAAAAAAEDGMRNEP